MKRTHLVITFLLCTALLKAQDNSTPCAADNIHQYRLQNETGYRAAFEQTEALIASHTAAVSAQSGKANNIIYIPVVIHVLHLGEPVGTGLNISDAAIMAAMGHLNDTWRNKYGNGVNMDIQFCLAAVDPSGNPTTGINRKDASVIQSYLPAGAINFSGETGGGREDSLKALSKWPMDKYVNVWTVGSIYNHSSVQGYAYYPVSNSYYLDGIVLKANTMNSTDDVLPHEMGHHFNLFHTFQGSSGGVCPANANCLVDGDKVCDTAPHKQGNCTPCDSTSQAAGNDCYNVMNYVPQALLFTQGQKDRVQACLLVPSRSWLLQNNYCGATSIGADAGADNAICLYPNPANSTLFIATPLNSPLQITIYNSTGAVVMQQAETDNKQVDISKLANGLYVAEIHQDGVTKRMRWIKL